MVKPISEDVEEIGFGWQASLRLSCVWALGALPRISLDVKTARPTLLRAVPRERVYGAAHGSDEPAGRALAAGTRAIVNRHLNTIEIGLLVLGNVFRISDPPEVGAELLCIPSEPIRRLDIDEKTVT